MVALEGKILDHYELRRLIGKGGMANVYEAQDLQFQRKVAVKVFKREDEEMLRRFIREARLMASLRHDHLVPIIDSGQCQLDNDTRYYIVMPFLEGGTLRACIRRSPLSLPEACRSIQEIASALDYIHSQGIIHRDIKASNVLLDARGDCYLTDFGIARITSDATQLTSTGDVLGTVDYVAPELFEINRRADVRSDLYSLGVLLFEMVTGRLPFIAENQIALVSMHIRSRPPSPRSIVPHLSSQVERVIFKALEKKPEQRYASATELAEAFCRAAGHRHKNDLLDRGHLPSVEQTEVVTPVAATDQAIPSSFPSATALNPTLRPSPLAHATEGYHLMTPPHVPPIARTEMPQPSLPPARPAPRPPHRRLWFSIVLAFLALVLLVVSIFSIIIPRVSNNNVSSTTQTATTIGVQSQRMSPTATPNLTATAQAASATAQAQQTATAIAAVTATAQAQASATAGVIQTATSGQPAYQDKLNNSTNQNTASASWDQNNQCAFLPDGYHVKESSNLHGCKESAYTYHNATITVDMQILSGYSGGLFFRINTFLFNYYYGYLFEIDSAGRYRISVSGNYSSGSTPLKDWTTSSALRRGINTNTLQVIARGSNLSFYANGEFLVQLTDTTYNTSGVVAFLARSDGTTPTEVVYSNLEVYPLS